MKCGIYVRVSTDKQLHRSQLAELARWKLAHDDLVFAEYRDKATGKNMARPGWESLWQAVIAGSIGQIVVWRLDRLGRTAAGLTKLFEDIQSLGVGLVSVRDSFDLATASGRLMANVLASVAAYETEVRSERVRAGIEAARAAGKTWGGRETGSRNHKTMEVASAVVKLHAAGEPISRIARTVGVSRPTVYSILGGNHHETKT